MESGIYTDFGDRRKLVSLSGDVPPIKCKVAYPSFTKQLAMPLQ